MSGHLMPRLQDDFGLDKIEVRDNGSGVAPGDAAVMGLAHYTSKIHCFDDLRK